MYYYRVSKYNPDLRDNSGSYLLNEWTSYSDIGKIYSGKKVSLESYRQVESLYIKLVLLAMIETNTDYLKIEELEKNEDEEEILKLSPKSKLLYQKLDNNFLVGIDEIPRLLKLQLRELISVIFFWHCFC